jgi:hypothetical protein
LSVERGGCGTQELEAFGFECFEQMLRVASGELSVGELCGHHQVQVWRDWPGLLAEAPVSQALASLN